MEQTEKLSHREDGHQDETVCIDVREKYDFMDAERLCIP